MLPQHCSSGAKWHSSAAQQVRWCQRWSGILCHVGLLWYTEAAKASSHVQVLLPGIQTANHSKGSERPARAMVERRSYQEVPAIAGSVIQLQLTRDLLRTPAGQKPACLAGDGPNSKIRSRHVRSLSQNASGAMLFETHGSNCIFTATLFTIRNAWFSHKHTDQQIARI